MWIHVAVLETFDKPRPDGLVCRHLDGNPKNNHISNLKWGTHKENVQDSIRHGTFPFMGKGENHPQAKLNEQKVKEIKILLKENRLSKKEIADKYNLEVSTIYHINKGKLWKQVII